MREHVLQVRLEQARRYRMDSLEYKVIFESYKDLVLCISHSPNAVVDKLGQLNILPPEDVAFLKNSSNVTDVKKATKIVDIVLNQVLINRQVYHTVLEAMRDFGDWAKTTVSKLEEVHKKYCSADTKRCGERGKQYFIFCI